MQNGLYIGLMSGTSLDGIDAALVDFNKHGHEIIAFRYTPWPSGFTQRLRMLCAPGENEIDRLGELDIEIADAFTHAVSTLLKSHSIDPDDIQAIGSHGQTIRHRPTLDHPFTLQIGDPNRIAEKSGITVVADFRRRDIAAGGEGAPLVPAYHAARFRTGREERIVLNIGGIANITLLPADDNAPVIGFDTGPGNTLLNAWIEDQRGDRYDHEGAWAAQGRSNPKVLASMLTDPYFSRAIPKSTGPEHFNRHWLRRHLDEHGRVKSADVQATLIDLTAESIALAVARHASECQRVIICGGGVHNTVLIDHLSQRLPGIALESSAAQGIDPDQIEAVAFAWLARQTLSGLSGNLPSVTGARHPVVLGGIYPAGQRIKRGR